MAKEIIQLFINNKNNIKRKKEGSTKILSYDGYEIRIYPKNNTTHMELKDTELGLILNIDNYSRELIFESIGA